MIPRIFPNSFGLQSDNLQQATSHVAIVTRTKDRPAMLSRAIDSVLSQTHQDWHLYIVNDGGERADVDALLARYQAALRGRVSVIHHAQNRGMEVAANVGMLASESTFVVIHDDDDSWHPEFLEATTGFLGADENRRYVGVVSHCTVVNERFDADGIVELDRSDWFSYPRVIAFSEMLKRNLFPPICLMFRRAATADIGFYNESLPMLCDWDFHIRLLMVGDIGVVPRRLAHYHIRASIDASPYSNSVRAGAGEHELFHVLYQNSFVRAALRQAPADAGFMSMLLHAGAESHHREMARAAEFNHANHQHFANVDAKLSANAQLLDDIQQQLRDLVACGDRTGGAPPGLTTVATRPLHWAWRKTERVRGKIARVRRRI